MPDKNAYDYYRLSNDTYFDLCSRSFRNYHPYAINETEKMKEEISDIERSKIEYVSRANEKCKNSLSIINGTFEFQKQYCEKRKEAIYLFNFTWLLINLLFVFIVLGVGILIGQRWRCKNE